jgi:biotin operon repressor
MQHIGRQIEVRARNIELDRVDPITQHGFTQLPNFLFKNSGLSMGAIVVYAKFLSYAWHNDYCFPGQERVAVELGMSRSRITEFISELEKKGFISITRRGQGMTNVYKIHFQVKGRKAKTS